MVAGDPDPGAGLGLTPPLQRPTAQVRRVLHAATGGAEIAKRGRAYRFPPSTGGNVADIQREDVTERLAGIYSFTV